MKAITYHYLRDSCNRYKGIHPIDWETFYKQIDFFQKNYNILKIGEEFGDFLKLDIKNKLIITFDDGLKEHLKAAKFLQKRNIQSLFFIIGCTVDDNKNKVPLVHKLHWLRSNIGEKNLKVKIEEALSISFNSFNSFLRKAKFMHIHDDNETALFKYCLNFILDYDQLDKATSEILKDFFDSELNFCEKYFLSKKNIKKIVSLGHLIGWHSQTHKPMSCYSKEILKKDLTLGNLFLEEMNSKSKKHLSYPYGRKDALPLKNMKEVYRSDFSYGWILADNNNYKEYQKFKELLLPRITPNEIIQS